MSAPYVMPPRKWGDEQAQEAPRPTVLVSSRDGVKPPPVRAAVRLAKAAAAAGWEVGVAYALAEVPEGWHRARRAYRLASVGVRLRRGDVRAWACWYAIDDGNWKFSAAYLGHRPVGARELTAALLEVPAEVSV